MKKYLLFLTLIMTTFVGCNKSYNKIEIVFLKSDSRDTIPIRYSYFKLSSKDSIFYNKEITYQIDVNKPYIFDSLPDGKYKLEYSTILKDTFTKSINLKNNHVYQSKIVFDSLPLQKYYKSVPINNLKNGESYKLFTWGGCVSTMYSSYEIKNKNDKYYFNSYAQTKKTLTVKDLEEIKKFEAQIYALNGKGGCNSTGQMTYTITTKTKVDTLKEMTCNWHGYQILMNELCSKK